MSALDGRLDARKMSGMQRKHRIPPEEGNKSPQFTYKHKGSRIFLKGKHFRLLKYLHTEMLKLTIYLGFHVLSGNVGEC